MKIFSIAILTFFGGEEIWDYASYLYEFIKKQDIFYIIVGMTWSNLQIHLE